MGKNKQTRKAENRKAQEAATLQCLLDYSKKVEVLMEQSSKLASRIASSQRAQRGAIIALKYINEATGESDHLYTQMGRCFLVQPRDKVIEELSSEIQTIESDLPRLKETFQQFEKLKKEQIDRITELKQQ